jgi:hypothetical protein
MASPSVTGGTVASILTAPPHQLSIEFGPNQDRTELHLVQIFDHGSSQGSVSINKKIGNLFPELVETTYAGALPLGAWELVIDSSVATQTITVQSTLAGLPKPTITASTATAPLLREGPNINVYVRRADFRFDYLLVIDTVP